MTRAQARALCRRLRFLGDRRSRRRPVLRRRAGARARSRSLRPMSANSCAAPAFAMMAWAAVHLKKEPDATYLGWLPLIERHAGDNRNFVKKAVNWALRQIGKRSLALHRASARTRRTPCRVERQDRALDRQGRGQGTGRCQDAGAAGKERVSCGLLGERDVTPHAAPTTRLVADVGRTSSVKRFIMVVKHVSC